MDNGDPQRQHDTGYEEHERTYKLFITLTQWGVAVVAIVLIGMALFLL